jgi:hypothetical protein
MNTSPLEQWNAIDQFTENFTVYNCAFLDILGYKEKALDYFNQHFNLYGRINRALAMVSTAQHLTAPVLNTTDLSIEIVSDSIVMMQPAAHSSLGTLLLFTCHFASFLSFEGLVIRGGIAQGRHIRKRTDQGFDFLASEALQKAYLLESQQAINPRILIDPDLISDLSSEERKLVIHENTDFIVHFAHYIINRKGANVADVKGEMNELHSAMSQHGNNGIRQKYQWLLDYYYWTIKQNPYWDANVFRHFSSGACRRFAELD